MRTEIYIIYSHTRNTFLARPYVSDCFTLKIPAVRLFESSVSIKQSTRRTLPACFRHIITIFSLNSFNHLGFIRLVFKDFVFCETKTALFILLTRPMEQSPSWEANRFSASQEIPHILWNTNVHHRNNKCPPTFPIPSQIDPVHPTSWRCIVI